MNPFSLSQSSSQTMTMTPSVWGDTDPKRKRACAHHNHLDASYISTVSGRRARVIRSDERPHAVSPTDRQIGSNDGKRQKVHAQSEISRSVMSPVATCNVAVSCNGRSDIPGTEGSVKPAIKTSDHGTSMLKC